MLNNSSDRWNKIDPTSFSRGSIAYAIETSCILNKLWKIRLFAILVFYSTYYCMRQLKHILLRNTYKSDKLQKKYSVLMRNSKFNDI